MNRIFTKAFGSYLVIIVLLSLLIVAFSLPVIQKYYLNTTIESLVRHNRILDASLSGYLVKNDYKSIDSLSKILGRQINTRITIILPDGRVVADSEKDPSVMENHSDRPEVIRAVSSGLGTSKRHSYSVNKDMLYVAIPVRSGQKLLAVSRLSMNLSDIDSLFDILRDNIIRIVIVVVAFSIIIAYLFARGLTRPINHLIDITRAVSGGNFDVRAKIKNNDEIKVLAENFNSMIARIKSLFTELHQQKELLNSIISSLHEGLVVLDSQGRIILSNDSFGRITGSPRPTGMHYWELLRDPNISKMLKKLTGGAESNSCQTEINKVYYLCSANIINDSQEFVLILYNINELKKLENIKRDFVTNISHELRTPLTVIKGYIETLEDSIDPENRKYLDFIRRHTNRLINIVSDLLLISELEEINIKLDQEETDLGQIIENVRVTLAQKIAGKNLDFNVNSVDSPKSIMADSFMLEQLFMNLIDNAVKYTDNGGISVTIGTDKNYAKIEISDTGIGIPDKDKDRIFERFYTVDKSRSRQLDGTGLGLSIVKHIVMMHKGRIEVANRPGGAGTTFTVYLPIDNQNN